MAPIHLSAHVTQLFAVIAAVSLLYFVFQTIQTKRRRDAFKKEHDCETPPFIPTRDPILGLDLMKENMNHFNNHTFLETLQKRHKKYGNTFSSLTGGRTDLITCEPENIKTFLATNFQHFSIGSDRANHGDAFLGRGIFTSDGSEWQHSRAMLRPNFASDQVRDLESLEVHVQHLIEAIPSDGSEVDLSPLFFKFTIDSATEFLFGESTNTLIPHLASLPAAEFAEKFNRSNEQLFRYLILGPLGGFASKAQYKKDAKFIHDFVDTYVKKGLTKRPDLLKTKPDSSTSKPRYLFLDALVTRTTSAPRIRSELLNILLAGRDTTASLLSNLFWTLSRRPDIQRLLRAEIDTLAGRLPTFADLRDMKYLRACINESLRLHPVVPSNSRQAVVDTVLPVGGGKDGKAPVFVKKGTMVNYSVYVMHRRTDLYGPDAGEFVPERWMGEKGLRPGWEYLPFNGGPRVCLGQSFALTEASYVAVRLLQAFAGMESRDAEEWRECITLTCTNLNGCKVAMREREG